MKCSIIRDLLPLYDIISCRKETREMVLKHLKECVGCRELYESMHGEVGLKDSINIQQKPDHDNEFWSKYYGTLLIKGMGIFFFVYGILIAAKVISG